LRFLAALRDDRAYAARELGHIGRPFLAARFGRGITARDVGIDCGLVVQIVGDDRIDSL
jgi:hypothetical protein